MQSPARDAPGAEIPGEAAKECRRAAQIEVGVAWHSQPLKHFEAQASRRVVIIAESITRSRFAVSDEASNARECGGEIVRLASKGMIGCISRAVQPPDLARGPACCQGMEHGQDRSRADAGAEQHHRSFARLQGEASSWRADFQDISTLDLRMEKAASLAVHFLFDAHPVGARVRRARHRIVAQEDRHVGRQP